MVLSIKPHRDALGLTEGQLLVDGAWRPAGDGRTWSHAHPATGEEVGTFAVAAAADVDRAVRAAARAFDEGAGPRRRSPRTCCCPPRPGPGTSRCCPPSLGLSRPASVPPRAG